MHANVFFLIGAGACLASVVIAVTQGASPAIGLPLATVVLLILLYVGSATSSSPAGLRIAEFLAALVVLVLLVRTVADRRRRPPT